MTLESAQLSFNFLQSVCLEQILFLQFPFALLNSVRQLQKPQHLNLCIQVPFPVSVSKVL